MPQLNRNHRGDKPARPYDGFPLFPHATRRWAKKIRGKLYYFGPWDDPDAALARFLRDRDDLYAGRAPRGDSDGATVRDAVNRFLTFKRHLADTREITQRSFADYYATCERIVDVIDRQRLVADLRPDDFERIRASLARSLGPVALGNAIQRIRMVFLHAFECGLIEQPMRFGAGFKRPSKRVLRAARHERGLRMFEAPQLRKILDAASLHLKAMVLLGLNCGYGNSDVAHLPRAALDLDHRWVCFPRPKTGIARRCPLWPETVEAIRASLTDRVPHKLQEDADLVFITKYGRRWARETSANPVSAEFRKLLRTVGIDRPGLNFYALRHTFETVGGESRDQVAVDAIMGHAPAANDMAAVYRERISDDRLKAVVEFVRDWLLR